MNSIFKKQFLLNTIYIFIVFLFLGGMLSSFFYRHIFSQKVDEMKDKANRLSTYFEMNYRYKTHSIYEPQYDKDEIYLLKVYSQNSFILLDENKKILFNTWDNEGATVGKTLETKEINLTYENRVESFIGDFNGLSEIKLLSLASPVVIDGKVKGVIIASLDYSIIEDDIFELIFLMILAMFFALILSLFISYIISRTFSKPLKEMSDVAEVISRGEFSKRLNVKSNDEIGNLALSFNEMAESLENQETVRREFLGNISHDLRSPITSIRGFIQAILDGTIPKDKMEYYLNIILEETERLITLANKIIESTKYESINKDISWEDFQLSDLVEKTVNSLKDRSYNKGIQIYNLIENDVFITAEYDLIQRVFYNLIDNALKFSNKGGRIIISGEKINNKYKVSIKDFGKGIEKENLKKVFDRFFKEDLSRNEDKVSSGLGLSIVKELLRLHNEDIRVISEKGKGSEFIFTLALAKNQ